MRHVIACLSLGLSLLACADDPASLSCPGGKTCGFTAIAAGYEHTCALYRVVAGAADDYGQVVCWGNNRDGRCGAATGFGETHALSPVVVAGLTDAVSITAGGTQSCALKASGTMVCWGGNGFGELGNGEPDGSFAPVTTELPPVAGDPAQLAAGGTSLGGTTCVRDDGDEIWCWGRNHKHQVRTADGDVQNVPVKVQGIADASDIAVGQDFACSIVSGVLRCWGSVYGTAPSVVQAVEGALDVSAKGFMACARTVDDVQCFTKPTDVVHTPIPRVSAVATGTQHTCALRNDDSRVVCWGNPGGGRLGLGQDEDPDDLSNELKLTPVRLLDASDDPLVVTQIASGASHSCALDDQHDIYCWGDNTQGQLGDGTETSRSTPTLVQLQR